MSKCRLLQSGLQSPDDAIIISFLQGFVSFFIMCIVWGWFTLMSTVACGDLVWCWHQTWVPCKSSVHAFNCLVLSSALFLETITQASVQYLKIFIIYCYCIVSMDSVCICVHMECSGRSKNYFLQLVLSFHLGTSGQSSILYFASPCGNVGLWIQGIAFGLLWVVDQIQVIRIT